MILGELADKLQISCEFLGSFKKKAYFCDQSLTFEIKDYGNINYTSGGQKCYGGTKEGT